MRLLKFFLFIVAATIPLIGPVMAPGPETLWLVPFPERDRNTQAIFWIWFTVTAILFIYAFAPEIKKLLRHSPESALTRWIVSFTIGWVSFFALIDPLRERSPYSFSWSQYIQRYGLGLPWQSAPILLLFGITLLRWAIRGKHLWERKHGLRIDVVKDGPQTAPPPLPSPSNSYQRTPPPLPQQGSPAKFTGIGVALSIAVMLLFFLAGLRSHGYLSLSPTQTAPAASKSIVDPCSLGRILGKDGRCYYLGRVELSTGDGRTMESRPDGWWYIKGTDEKATVLRYGRILEQREDQDWYYRDTGEKWVPTKAGEAGYGR
jgi:hypothetical protein